MTARWLCCWLLCLLAAAYGAPKPTEPLTISVNAQDLQLRRDAPIPLEAVLENHTPQLQEGRLEVTILIGTRVGSSVLSPELVLGPGKRPVSLLLPPLTGAEMGDGVAVRLRFVGKATATALGDQRLGTVGLSTREQIIAIARTDRRLADLVRARERSLHLENLRPSGELNVVSFTTLEAPLPVSRLPTHPVGWCAYDAAIIDGPAFLAMSEKQLDALARWIDGGGSAAIFAETALEDRHLAFLQKLASDDGITVDLDEQSRPSFSQVVPLRLAPGLGRVILTTANVANEKDFKQPKWRGLVAWLWKASPDAQRLVDWKGEWPPREDSPNIRTDLEMDDWLLTGGMGYSELAPDQPRPLPIGLIAVLLGALLFIAGPLDWWVLGRLRRRRWTWVSFSLLCVVCAWLAAHLAGHYLGRQGRTGLVRIIDIGPGNRLLRETCIEMVMFPDDREWRTETIDGICTALRDTHYLGRRPYGMIPWGGQNYSPRQRTAEVNTANEWLGPGHLIQRQTLHQWTPAWRQTLAFPTSLPEGPHWDSLIAAWRPPQQEKGWPRSALRSGGFCFQFVTDTRVQKGSEGMHFDSPVTWADGDSITASKKGETLMLASPSRLDPLYQWLLFSRGNRREELLANESPAPGGPSLPQFRLSAPLGILAWRETEHELHIYRRHVARRELEKKP